MIVTRKRREELLAEFDRSAMTGRKFAAWAGIKPTTFANWLQMRRKLRDQKMITPEAGASTHWLEAVVGPRREEEGATKMVEGEIIVHGPGGIRLELKDARQIKLAAQLLRELDEKRRC